MICHRIADLRAIESVQNTTEIQLAIGTAYLGNVSKMVSLVTALNWA